MSTSRKPFLVGESNPYGADPEMALYPLPERASGGRLCFGILGITMAQYLRCFERRNLVVGGWYMKAARAGAVRVLAETDASSVLILLGARVSGAFDLEFKPFSERECYFEDPTEVQPTPRWVIQLPHPSGRSRLWNGAEAGKRARDLVLPRVGALLTAPTAEAR